MDLAAREAGHFGGPFWNGPVNKAFEQLHDKWRVCDDPVAKVEQGSWGNYRIGITGEGIPTVTSRGLESPCD